MEASLKLFFKLKRPFQLCKIILILTLTLHCSEGAIDLVKECSNAEEGHVTRGSFTCCSQSPGKFPLQSSLDFRAGWKRCAVPPKTQNEDPVISAWRVYRCILFLGMRGKPLKPSTYARLMTARYPGNIKNQIVSKMSQLEDDDMKFEVDVDCLKRTPYPKITLLRNIFYEIEQEVCEGGEVRVGMITESSMGTSRSRRLFDVVKKSSTFSTKELSEILCETCERRQEMYHRNGDCCSQVSLPFPFINLAYRYANQDRVRQCAEDVVDDVGLPSDTVFATHLKHLCYTSCEHYLSGTISESDLWSGLRLLQSKADLKTVSMKMMPKYFSRKYKDELIEFILENFRSAWQETKTFESREQLSQRDIRNYDKVKLRNLLASCRGHRLIETVANLYLNNICFDQYASSYDKNSRTTPKYQFSSFYNSTNVHNPPIPPKEGQDVILNFDWNQNPHDSGSQGQVDGLFDDIPGYSQPKRNSSSSYQHRRGSTF